MSYHRNYNGKLSDDMVKLFKKYIGRKCNLFFSEPYDIQAFEVALTFQEGILHVRSDYELSEVKDKVKYEFSHFIVSEGDYLSDKLKEKNFKVPINAILEDVFVCRESSYCLENNVFFQQKEHIMDFSFDEILRHSEDINEFAEFDSGICFAFGNMYLKLEMMVFVDALFSIDFSKGKPRFSLLTDRVRDDDEREDLIRWYYAEPKIISALSY